ncbi:DUF3667 domain-containing protein [Fulvivirgaceae bacterium BMA10]|uniref:DUF3667 domain-containing protein n=1 Tax=Splendidivirga corallicola TaxID=3051826 RepID=A0ABT8KVM7_9BACT|nr:DUF3667 domain-containing protein [Fulvivirgaceae bacterium BMA10]
MTQKSKKTTTQSQQKKCLTCGTDLMGMFCYQCGEKVIERKDRSILTLLEQLINAFTFADSKLLRTIKYFLFNPGFLVNEYIAGKRKRYIAPLSFFFIVNILFFIFNPISDFNLNLYDQVNHQIGYSSWAKSLVEERLEERGITLQQYGEMYNKQSGNLSKSLIILNVPLVALFIMLLNFRSSRFYVDHFIFALNIFAFVLLWSMLGYVLVSSLIYTTNLLGWTQSDTLKGTSILLIPIVSYVYFLFAQKSTYQRSWAYSAFAAFMALAGIVLTQGLYRFFLFVVTFVTT